MALLQMSPLRNIALPVLLLSLLSSAALAAEAPAKPSEQQQSLAGRAAEPVARVNGKEITALELKNAVATLLATQPDVQPSPEAMKKLYNNMLDSLISQELVYQEGVKLKIADLEKRVNEVLAQQKARYVNDGYFQKSLASLGMTEKELTDSIRNEIVVRNFIAKTVDEKVSVTGEEVKKFYDQNIDRFTTPEQVRVSRILIAAEPSMDAEEKKNALNKAKMLRKQIADGTASFDEIARKYSNCPSSKIGGDLGYLVKKDMPAVFAQAVFALNVGELSEVVETKAGFEIIRIRDRRASVTKPYAEVRPQIEEYLRKEKSDAAMRKLLEELRKKGHVEVLLK